MGQKVNPISFRTGVAKNWQSRWFAQGREYGRLLIEDMKLRKALEKKLSIAGLHNIEIERLPRAMTIRVYVSRPGVVIGRGGQGIEDLKKFIVQQINQDKNQVHSPKIEIIVEELKNPDFSARLVAQRVVAELERRLPQRRVVNKTIDRVMASGAKGIKILLSGRIGGAEIARREKFQRGSMPTQSLRSNIDYFHQPASLSRGYVGVKVWINRPEEQ